MEKQKTPYISIKKGNGKIKIHSGYTIFHNQFREGGRISCVIPAYDVYYSVDSPDKIVEKGTKIIRMYIDHFMSHSKNKLKDFVIQIHKLGFKAPNDAFTMKTILDNKDITTKFSSQKPIEDSLSESKKEMVDEMELAF